MEIEINKENIKQIENGTEGQISESRFSENQPSESGLLNFDKLRKNANFYNEE